MTELLVVFAIFCCSFSEAGVFVFRDLNVWQIYFTIIHPMTRSKMHLNVYLVPQLAMLLQATAEKRDKHQ